MGEKLLAFLKGFPAWLVLSTLFVLCLWLYLRTADTFLQRVIDTLLGGLLGVVTGRALPSATQTGNTVTGDVINLPEPDKPTEDLSKVTEDNDGSEKG